MSQEIAVEFGTMSADYKKAGIPFKVSRDQISRDDAESLFCGARISVILRCDPNATEGEADGQQTMLNTKVELERVADVHRYSTDPENYSARLAFIDDGLSLDELRQFAKREGWLFAERIGDGGTDTADEREPEGAEV